MSLRELPRFPLPGAALAAFAAWLLGDGPVTIGGQSVLSRIARVPVPALFLAGGAALIAPAQASEPGGPE